MSEIGSIPEKVYVDLVLIHCRHAKGNSTPYASNN